MDFRRATGVLIAALAVAVVTGCTPGITPSASPTPSFSSSTQAFAAAEKTYRAYVDASNHVDFGEQGTFEPVYKWLTGDALAEEKKSLTQMSADGWRMEGTATVAAFRPMRFAADSEPIAAATVCLDVKDVRVTDADGTSVVSPDRPSRQPLSVTFVKGSTPTSLSIASSEVSPDGDICAL